MQAVRVASRAWATAGSVASMHGRVMAQSGLGLSSLGGTRWRGMSSASTPAEVSKPRPAAEGTTPDIFDHATGLERAELEAPDIFKHNEVIKAPFGTAEAPVLVESAFDSRIVGCTGEASPNDHDIHWLEVIKGKQVACPLCGQIFALKQI
eukprot:CAMPEP_0198340540 /NCGR_PEP_ID=MMETSP1450-20131203/44948_1 /TAXON_ID=753684 ORGANISM="Madagascaria erythrocladiodes, Strain CCMP3234" /NCGR_SAMPLE_ID=MMETSP1450 /ASSEMBLY_ACC=CAM_ASM_001115 /LENGTH=150 /DNA_ID=CAMNT_0044045525 /DNA_START=118 /DNA_END=570 /DNA_ORIENTATION=-